MYLPDPRESEKDKKSSLEAKTNLKDWSQKLPLQRGLNLIGSGYRAIYGPRHSLNNSIISQQLGESRQIVVISQRQTVKKEIG